MSTTNIAPGIVVVPLNLPGPEYAGLTVTYDFTELIGAGGFGEVWRTLSRGTGDWHEHVTKVSFEPPESDRVRLAWHGTMAVAARRRTRTCAGSALCPGAAGGCGCRASWPRGTWPAVPAG